jgi:hypothetical protein
MANYRLNLNQQLNGDYEVHENGCIFYPTLNYDNLGYFGPCAPAITEAKQKHPYKKINGCIHCANLCHTS